MTDYEAASLVTQWIAAIASILAVGVAIVFGILTLANSRRSKDAQDRASYAAVDASDPVPADFADAVKSITQVNWQVIHEVGESWLLRHSGSTTAYGVLLSGLTDSDNQRLTVPPGGFGNLGPTGTIGFVFTSRLTRSGPGNIVVTFSLENNGPRISRVVRVPVKSLVVV